MTVQPDGKGEKAEHVEHDVPAGGYFTPKLYLQRYDFVKKFIKEANARTVIDLGCAECKFVKELALMDLRRVIGIDLDQLVLENGSNYFKPNFDDYYCPYSRRAEPVLIELYKGNACLPADPRIIGVDFVSCIELIEHINPEDHPGIIKTIFNDIKPLTAVITTPNGEFNSHWPTMPHGNYRHEDHRFEWTRAEFTEFVTKILTQYPEYEAVYDGIGEHWGGDQTKGPCSQAAIFKLMKPNPDRPVMVHEKDNVDELFEEDVQIQGTYTYEKFFSTTIDRYRFEDRIYKAVMRALDPFLGIATQHNDLHDVNSNHDYEYNRMKAGVHHEPTDFYNKPVIGSGVWIPEHGICDGLDEEFAQSNRTIRKIGVKVCPQLTNYFKYTFDDPEYARRSNYESDIEEEDASMDVTGEDCKKADVHWKVSRWQTENIGRVSPVDMADGWSIPSATNSNENEDAFLMETSGREMKPLHEPPQFNYDELGSKIHGIRMKMKMEAVPGQFDDCELDDNASPPVIRKFEDLPSAESVDYTEEDGFPLGAVLNFFTVKMVMEKNEVPDKDMDTILIDTLMELKNAGKTDFDVFQTKKGQIRVKLIPVSKYDHDNGESEQSSYEPVDMNDVKDYASSAGSEW